MKKMKHLANFKQKKILNNKCLVENFVYKATIWSEKETKNYFGETLKKDRWYNHRSDFKNYIENGTEISKYIWNLKITKLIIIQTGKWSTILIKAKTQKVFAVLAY